MIIKYLDAFGSCLMKGPASCKRERQLRAGFHMLTGVDESYASPKPPPRFLDFDQADSERAATIH